MNTSSVFLLPLFIYQLDSEDLIGQICFYVLYN